jgi:hypothetical protein
MRLAAHLEAAGALDAVERLGQPGQVAERRVVAVAVARVGRELEAVRW